MPSQSDPKQLGDTSRVQKPCLPKNVPDVLLAEAEAKSKSELVEICHADMPVARHSDPAARNSSCQGLEEVRPRHVASCRETMAHADPCAANQPVLSVHMANRARSATRNSRNDLHR